MTSRLVLVVPADVHKPTGGNRYDRSLAAALHRLGTDVEQRLAAGGWPVATAADRDRLAQLMHGPDPVLVDGLVACGAPGAVARAVAGGCRLHVLVHMPLALDRPPSADRFNDVLRAAGRALARRPLRRCLSETRSSSRAHSPSGSCTR